MLEQPLPPPAPEITLGALFGGFFKVGISGFGGVLPWARRMIVEERKWLTEREFVETLSLCQLLPGPNIVNVSIAVGSRFKGAMGAVAAFTGLMLAPFAIVLLLASFYGRYVHVPAVHGTFRGVSAAAAGLVVAMGFKMVAAYRVNARAAVFVALTFFAVAVMRFPLGWVVLGLGPVAVFAAYRSRL